MATGDRDGVLVVRDAGDLFVRRRIRLDAAVNAAAFLDDTLVAGTEAGSVVGLDREGEAVFEHEGPTGVAALVSAGGRLVVARKDGVVQSPTRAGSQLEEWTRVDGRPTALAAAADGTVAVGTDDGRIHAVAPDGTPVWRSATHGRAIMGLSYCLDDRRIIAAGGDYKVRLFDAAGGEMYMVVGTHTTVASAVACHGDTLVSAGYDRVIRLWDIPD